MVLFDTVTKRYPENITALEDVCFQIDNGEFCSVMGPSGAGKSTILKLLIREELPTSGNIFYEDLEVPKIPKKLLPSYRQKLGIVFQDMKLLETRTLAENINFALEILKKNPKEIKDTTDYLLELVGLQDRKNLFPEQLSGGEQQRGAIARALASNPGLFVADEPTGNLDPDNSAIILGILKKINASGTTVLVISHDLEFIKEASGRVIKLKSGRVVEDSKEGSKVVENKVDSKFSNDMSDLSTELKEKLGRKAIYTPDILLNLTESDFTNLSLNKKEEKEVGKFIKNYLNKKNNGKEE